MPRIAVLTGGESAEREIALLSAQFIQTQVARFFDYEVFDLPQDLLRFVKEYRRFEAVVPVFHGRGGEDGQIQGFLETLGMPYIFSGIEGHALGMNKIWTKQMAQVLAIKQPHWQVIEKDKPLGRINLPAVIKPYDGGSSKGVLIVHDTSELKEGLIKVWNYSRRAVIEEYLDGEEYTVGVIDTDQQTQALPVIGIKPKKGNFFDYESKYSDGGAEEICPAPIKQSLAIKLQQIALHVHQAFNLKHMSRSDFIVVNNQPYFLEVNTIPGLTKNSLIPKAVKASGRDFGVVLQSWINAVINQHS